MVANLNCSSPLTRVGGWRFSSLMISAADFSVGVGGITMIFGMVLLGHLGRRLGLLSTLAGASED